MIIQEFCKLTLGCALCVGSIYMRDYLPKVLKILVRYMREGEILSRGCVDARIVVCRALGCCTAHFLRVVVLVLPGVGIYSRSNWGTYCTTAGRIFVLLVGGLFILSYRVAACAGGGVDFLHDRNRVQSRRLPVLLQHTDSLV